MSFSAPLAPASDDQDVYLVVDDFGVALGCAWCGTRTDSTDRQSLIRDLLEGRYTHPVRILAFNATEGWSRGVSVEIAEALLRRAEFDELPEPALEFIAANRR
jgi:hypothetical protein